MCAFSGRQLCGWRCEVSLHIHFFFHFGVSLYMQCHARLDSTFFRRVRKIAKYDYWLRHVCLSVRPSVRMELLGSQWTDFY
jgi:hypothetical protein